VRLPLLIKVAGIYHGAPPIVAFGMNKFSVGPTAVAELQVPTLPFWPPTWVTEPELQFCTYLLIYWTDEVWTSLDMLWIYSFNAVVVVLVSQLLKW